MQQIRQYKTIDKIPYSENAIQDFVEQELRQYQGKAYFCKTLGVYVSITRNSIKETAYNCRFNRQSAELAIELPYIIQHAKIKQLHLPTKSQRQIRHFRFIEIATLICNVKGKGIAKLTIGFRDNGDVLEYSVTNYQTNKTSQFID